MAKETVNWNGNTFCETSAFMSGTLNIQVERLFSFAMGAKIINTRCVVLMPVVLSHYFKHVGLVAYTCKLGFVWFSTTVLAFVYNELRISFLLFPIIRRIALEQCSTIFSFPVLQSCVMAHYRILPRGDTKHYVSTCVNATCKSMPYVPIDMLACESRRA